MSYTEASVIWKGSNGTDPSSSFPRSTNNRNVCSKLPHFHTGLAPMLLFCFAPENISSHRNFPRSFRNLIYKAFCSLRNYTEKCFAVLFISDGESGMNLSLPASSKDSYLNRCPRPRKSPILPLAHWHSTRNSLSIQAGVFLKNCIVRLANCGPTLFNIRWAVIVYSLGSFTALAITVLHFSLTLYFQLSDFEAALLHDDGLTEESLLLVFNLLIFFSDQCRYYYIGCEHWKAFRFFSQLKIHHIDFPNLVA